MRHLHRLRLRSFGRFYPLLPILLGLMGNSLFLFIRSI